MRANNRMQLKISEYVVCRNPTREFLIEINLDSEDIVTVMVTCYQTKQ